jgi:sulfide:quinone oxidoreductase
MTRSSVGRGSAIDVHDVIIVGGGAAGIAVAASLLARAPGLDVVVVDPSDVHCYQPGWTMVGAGLFNPSATVRKMSRVLPRGVRWMKAAVEAFDPARHTVVLSDRRTLAYRQLVVCPGLELGWNGVEGLADTLGRNGVTSNYRFDLAPYTWRLVQGLRGGRAVFTQPPMPIKCAGAPQKAMYLSADRWRRNGRLASIDIELYSAAPVLFGVADYVPALMRYVHRYDARLNFNHKLIAVDGGSRTATFARTDPGGSQTRVRCEFDMLHAVPPQIPPSFVRASPLVDAAG